MENPCCSIIGQTTGQSDLERFSQELRLENKKLKTDIMEMKMELRHCMEKMEGPMKMNLECEECKCTQLETELKMAAKNMIKSQDAYMKEMEAVRRELCEACSNVSELTSMNKKLTDEMRDLDCKCAKLEDDLVTQKIKEAETLQLLKKKETCQRCGM